VDKSSSTINRVSGSYNKLNKTSNKTVSTMSAAAGSMVLLGGGLAALRGAFGAAKAAGDFQQTLNKVGQITTATAADMKVLEKTAIDAALSTQFSPQEAIEGLEQLGVQGFNATESAVALGGALDLAAGGQISVAQASMTTAAALRVFNIDVKDSTLAVDKLLKISTATALSANDLQIALANISPGSKLAKQGIDEMLPSIGLVKNAGFDASVASSSVARALSAMAKKSDQFKKLGVNVGDADGKFRPFLDIILDTKEALGGKFTSEVKRSKKALELFGQFGVKAFAAIGDSLEKGITTPTGDILKGAEAIEFLREAMANAGGAAAKFREAALDNLTGDVILLQGTIQGLQVMLGRDLADAFRPIVQGMRSVITKLIDMWSGLSEPARKAIARVVVFGSAIAVAAGAVGTLIFGAQALGAVFGAAGFSLGDVAALLLRFVPIIGAVALVISGFRSAAESDFGGFGKFFERIFTSIRLTFGGLAQVFSDGFLSGEIMKDLNKAENKGIKQFVIDVVAFVDRIQNALRGLKEGFGGIIDGAEPAFTALREMMTDIGKEFGFVFDEFNSTTDDNSASWKEWGANIGQIFAKAVVIVVKGIVIIGRFILGVIRAAKDLQQKWDEAFSGVRKSVKSLVDAWIDLQLTLHPGMDETAVRAESLGESFSILGGMFDLVTTPARFFIAILRTIIKVVDFVIEKFQELFGWASRTFDRIAEGFQAAADAWPRTLAVFDRGLDLTADGLGISGFFGTDETPAEPVAPPTPEAAAASREEGARTAAAFKGIGQQFAAAITSQQSKSKQQKARSTRLALEIDKQKFAELVADGQADNNVLSSAFEDDELLEALF